MDIEMEDAVKEKRVIKLMLQPLVENAVFHGLEQKLEDGEVNVSIHMHGEDHIMFVVEDNGCGIEPARLVWMRDNHGTEGNRGGQYLSEAETVLRG